MKAVGAGLACLLVAGCGGGSHVKQRASLTPVVTATKLPVPSSTATFEATPNITTAATSTPPTATPTPTPTAQTVYELTQESRLRFTDGGEEIANGSLVVTPCFSPNTYYAYRIESVEILSESVAIRSDSTSQGIIEAVTLYEEDQAVTFTATVSINGQAGHLSGWGPLDEGRSGDTLDLELKSASFRLYLKAVRIGPAYERGSFREWCYYL